jgi:4-hydroxybenzoate polyprenyltransferase
MSTVDRLLPPEDTFAGYLLRLSRPRFWMYLAGPVVVGVTFGAASPAELFSPLALALFAYFVLPANVYLYGVNDVFDADIDAENPKKEDKEVRYTGDRTTLAVVGVSGLAGLAFLPVLGGRAAAAMVAFLLLATEYSAPPFRFKTTPFVDSLSNGLYVLPAVVAYAALAGSWPPLAAFAAGWLWTMAMHTFSAIPDIDPDRRAGIRTTATVLGERRTFAYCAALWVGAALAFGQVHAVLGAILAPYPVIAVAIERASVDVDRAYWWFPAINTFSGMLLTLVGLWVMLYGA